MLTMFAINELSLAKIPGPGMRVVSVLDKLNRDGHDIFLKIAAQKLSANYRRAVCRHPGSSFKAEIPETGHK